MIKIIGYDKKKVLHDCNLKFILKHDLKGHRRFHKVTWMWPFLNLILSEHYMNANIIRTQIIHWISYDFKIINLLLDIVLFIKKLWLMFLWTSFVLDLKWEGKGSQKVNTFNYFKIRAKVDKKKLFIPNFQI